MIPTPLRTKILFQTRSTSLPSRSHPLIPNFTHHLQKLQQQPTTPPSLTSIAKNLPNLHHLCTCLDDLLLLHHTHQVFAHERHDKWVEQILDGYLGLVDACATAKEFVFHAKEHVAELLSVLRRRRDSDDHLSTFLNSRKTAQKMIHKSLRSISSFKSNPSVYALDKDQETIAVVSMLKEAESAILELIESLLISLAGTKGSSSRWSLVSRLIGPRRSSGREAVEFGEIEGLLCKISVSFRTSMSRCEDVGVQVQIQIDELQQQLRCADGSLGVIEEELEKLFKRLIRTRVSLLNMHSQ